MWIRGFVHEDFDNAFRATVQLVDKWTADHRAGVYVGYMEFTDGTEAEVFKHPGGTFYGYISEEA